MTNYTHWDGRRPSVDCRASYRGVLLDITKELMFLDDYGGRLEFRNYEPGLHKNVFRTPQP